MASDRAQAPVGVIGLGLVGMVVARRLIAAGFAVVGFDIDAAKGAALAAIGGQAAASIGALGEACGPVLLTVFDTAQVEAVVEGADGLLAAGGAPGRVVVNISTCEPERVVSLAARMAARGAALVEMPISGSSGQIADGDGLGLLGGEAAAIAEVELVLAAICPRRHVVGAIGSGGRAKLAINLILGLNRAALAEGLAYAERLGLDLPAFLEVALDSAAYSQVMDVKGARMITRDYAPHGKIVQSLKDFSLIRDTAEAAGQGMPLASVYLELMRGCVRAGEGEWDNSAVVEEIRRRRG